MTPRRTAGLALALFGLGTATALAGSGPGGEYRESSIAAWAARDHWFAGSLVAYLGLASALMLLVLAEHAPAAFGRGGAAVGRLALVASGVGVVGWILSGGITVALIEGGPTARTGLTHPVTYVLSEMANLVAACGPAIVLGAGAVILGVLAPLPVWLRILSLVAGVCGITAPLFFTFFIFVGWCLVMGVWLVVERSDRLAVAAVVSEPEVSRPA